MRNREFYETQLKALETVNSEPDHIRQVEAEIKQLEDKAKQAKADKEQGIRGTGLNNQEKHRLKELRTERTMIERKEELEVLLNMNGMDEFTQEAEQEEAQDEALEMVDQMVSSDAERAANEAEGATTLEEGRTLTGKTAQREGLKGYYETSVPAQLTKRGEVQSRKDQMSKNSMLGASMQLVTLNKLLTRDDLSDAQINMINKLINYFNRVLDTLDAADRQFEENVRSAEEVERDAGEETPTETQGKQEIGNEASAPEVGGDGEVAEHSAEEHETATETSEDAAKPEEEQEQAEAIDYDNLTEEQKRQFQIQGARANLENLVAQLRELSDQKDVAKQQLEQAEKDGNEVDIRNAQYAISRINMKMTPLRNQVQELVAKINELEGRTGPDEPERAEGAEAEKPAQEAEERDEGAEPAAAPVAGAEEKKEKEEQEEPEQSEEEQNKEPTVIEHATGIRAILEAFIRVLQAITHNPKLLEGARQKLVDVKYMPAGISPKMTTVPEGSVTKEDAEKVATEVGEAEQAEEVGKEVEEAEEERKEPVEENGEHEETEEVVEETEEAREDVEPETREASDKKQEDRPAWELPEDEKDAINARSSEIAQEIADSHEPGREDPSKPGKTEGQEH